MRKTIVALLALSLGAAIGMALPVGAHGSGRNSGHGDCNSTVVQTQFYYDLDGTQGDDQCNGHDTNPNDDFMHGQGGKDTMSGEGGDDRPDGGEGADHLSGGGNGAGTTKQVFGEKGGSDDCGDSNDPGRCEKLNGGGDTDLVSDNAGPQTGDPSDWDRACDGPGDNDEVDIDDGDGLDKTFQVGGSFDTFRYETGEAPSFVNSCPF